ncbi:MAG: bifunctional 4-hydroxy-2-oxoglutarate aldolase/2-dehydro-3-deoxy-phosphogluconate aldolase [Verrucomicrobiota bacterium]
MSNNAGIFDRVAERGVVSVLTVEDEEQAVPLARALLAGGVDAMELTLRTPAAMGALKRIRKEVPEMIAGIGTILNLSQVAEVVEAGASFGVSPGLNEAVVAEARRRGLPFAPGVATPSEVERALELDCVTLKFFPAEPMGGLGYLKAMAAPYKHLGVRFLPLGGLSPANMETYLEESCVAAIGGSWIASPALIQSADWKTIESNAAGAVASVKRVRG